MKTKHKPRFIFIAKSMIGGAGLALAECRAQRNGEKLSMAMVNESTRATFFVVLAIPLVIACFLLDSPLRQSKGKIKALNINIRFWRRIELIFIQAFWHRELPAINTRAAI